MTTTDREMRNAIDEVFQKTKILPATGNWTSFVFVLYVALYVPSNCCVLFVYSHCQCKFKQLVRWIWLGLFLSATTSSDLGNDGFLCDYDWQLCKSIAL